MRLKDVLEKTTQHFQEKGFSSPRLDAELLLAHGLNFRKIDLYLKWEQPLTESELSNLRVLVKRRSQGEPIAYILGKKDFYRETFSVGPGVLVPRPETELLVELALDHLKKQNPLAPLLVDMGTGSGCIGLSLLAELPQSQLIGIEKSEEALSYAKKNAETLGLSDRVIWILGDVTHLDLSQWTQKADIVVSNPPYIGQNDKDLEENVRKHEPALALFGGEEGFESYKKWLPVAKKLLSPGGLCLFEIGSDQAAVIQNYFSEEGLREIRIHQDLSRHDRVITGLN